MKIKNIKDIEKILNKIILVRNQANIKALLKENIYYRKGNLYNYFINSNNTIVYLISPDEEKIILNNI